MTFVKKLTEVEATQWTGGVEDAERVIAWIEERGVEAYHQPPYIPGGPDSGRVETEDLINIDDPIEPKAVFATNYVVHSEDDGIYVRSKEAFERTYEEK